MKRSLYNKRYNKFIFPVSFFTLTIATILGFLFAPETFSAIVLIILGIWVYKTAKNIVLCVKNYEEVETNRYYNWNEKEKLLESRESTIANIKADMQLLDDTFHFSHASFFNRLLIRLSNNSSYYSTFLTLQKELSRIENISPDELLKPSQIQNLLVIASYRETVETLSQTFDAILQQEYDKRNLIIVLAMEERDDTADSVFKEIQNRYGDSLPHIMQTKHSLAPHERVGKASNCRASLQQVIPQLQDMGLALKDIIVTAADADVIFSKHYFSCLTWTFCTDKNRFSSLYHGIPIFMHNYKELSAIGQVTATLNTIGTIATIKSRYIHPQSTISLSLQTLQEIDLWDPTIMSDDEHIYKKMFLKYRENFHPVPILVEIYMSVPNANKYFASLKTLYEQIQRWTYGALILNQHVFSEFTYNKNLSFKDRFFTSVEKIERTILWPFYSITIVFGLTAIQLIRTSYTSSQFASYTHLLTIVITVINLFLLAFLIGIDYYIRSQQEFSKFRPHAEIIHLLRWIYFPLLSIFLGFLPYVDSNLRIVLGKELNFKKSLKMRTTKV